MPDLLLDTHAAIWAIHEPDRLSLRAREAIEDPTNRLRVSAATGWELATKHRLGKLPQADGLIATFMTHVDRLGASPLDISLGHALLAGSLDWDHRDPFDRMLAAQAISETCTLVTKDPEFSTCAGLRLLW